METTVDGTIIKDLNIRHSISNLLITLNNYTQFQNLLEIPEYNCAKFIITKQDLLHILHHCNFDIAPQRKNIHLKFIDFKRL